jgi:quinoprotein glucose dehydrogenase
VGIWRPGDNVGADSTFALDAMTGKIIWGFQNHHHDLFDQDTMAPPVPVEITKDGKKIRVIVQTTKQGMMWIIDDKTGKPLFPYEEKPVPQSDLPGEKTARTQPFTQFPPPLAQMTISRDNLSNLSPHSNADCKAVWDQNGLKEGGPFLPPAKNGAWTVMNTGAIGGINWGGASIDVDRGYAITNVVNMPTMIQVTEGPKAVKGNDSLSFSSGYKRFSDSDGRTCAGGRHGELVAVELATGKIVWRVPLGALDVEYGEKAKEIGATNIGPSLVTRGGVIFIGAATDDRFHAYDTATGKLLWQTKMAASSNAGPMTYIGKDGRQYVVIAAGGPGNARRRSAKDNFVFHQTLVAFALPKPGEKEIDIVTPYPKREPQPGDDMGLAQ